MNDKNLNTKGKYLLELDGKLNDLIFLSEKIIYLANEVHKKTQPLNYGSESCNARAFYESRIDLETASEILKDYVKKLSIDLKSLELEVDEEFSRTKQEK